MMNFSPQNSKKINNGALFMKFIKSLLETITKNKNEIDFYQCFDDREELLKGIKDAKDEWEEAILNFEHADNNDIVDYYTYKIKACQIKYNFLIKKAKEKEIK